jgi:hypothetical protein
MLQAGQGGSRQQQVDQGSLEQVSGGQGTLISLLC